MRERSDLDTKYVGTVFDRQARIEQWDQDLLRKQTVLCLGAGGLGSVVIMNLLRLGVKKIIIVDYDKVDLHNLNRQFMYTLQDVGQSKVQSCIKNAKFHNVGDTELVGFQGCAVSNWQKIISFTQQSDFIFNMIDYGDWFDAAIQSLCFKLKKPFVMGGTFALSLIVDYLSPHGRPCYWCMTDQIARQKQFSDKLRPEVILTYESLKFLPKNDNPIGRSSVCICTTCGEFMIAHFLNALFFDKQYKTQRTLFYPTSFQTVNFPVEPEKACVLCGIGEEETPKEGDKEVAKEVANETPKEVANETQKEATTETSIETPATQQPHKQQKQPEAKQQTKPEPTPQATPEQPKPAAVSPSAE